MSISRRIRNYLLLVGLLCLALDGIAAQADAPAASIDSIVPWETLPSPARLEVVGESLEVVLIDPLGRRDTWEGTERKSRIPNCDRSTGLFGRSNPPARIAGRVYVTSFRLRAIPGEYKIQVTSRRGTTPTVVIAEQPFTYGCRARDSIAIARGERAEWTLSWSNEGDQDTCWTRLRRSPQITPSRGGAQK